MARLGRRGSSRPRVRQPSISTTSIGRPHAAALMRIRSAMPVSNIGASEHLEPGGRLGVQISGVGALRKQRQQLGGFVVDRVLLEVDRASVQVVDVGRVGHRLLLYGVCELCDRQPVERAAEVLEVVPAGIGADVAGGHAVKGDVAYKERGEVRHAVRRCADREAGKHVGAAGA